MTPFEITLIALLLIPLIGQVYYRVKIIQAKDRIIKEQEKQLEFMRNPIPPTQIEKYTRYKVRAEVTTPDFELIQSHPNKREHAALIQNKLNSKLYDELITCGYVRYYDVNKFEHGLTHVAELEIIVKQ